MADATLKNNTDAKRYELVDDGTVVGFCDYTMSGDTVTITHTEIGKEHAGKGYGSALAKQVLGQLQANNQKLVPQCEFIAGYVQKKHPEYSNLLAS
jgi:predicted GNAT family acetyltransferase